MERLLSEDEQKQVMDEIKRLQNEKRNARYVDLMTDIPAGQEEFYNGLKNLFLEKDAINDQRDSIENSAFLQFVPVRDPSPLTPDQVTKVAQGLIKMGYVKKVELVFAYSTEAREEGQINLKEDVKKAIKGKENAKKSIIARAQKMKEIFRETIATVRKEVEQIDKEIERLQGNKDKFTEQLAALDAPRIKQEIEDTATGRTKIISSGDTPKQIEEKRNSLNTQISNIETEIQNLMSSRRIKVEEITKLEVQFGEIVARIDKELRDKGMTLEQSDSSSTKNDSESEKNGENKEDNSNGGQPLTEKERKQQSKNKAKNMVYGINESLTQEEILEHIRNGRLDHFVEMKRKLTNSPAEMGKFNESLKQILEGIALKDPDILADGNITIRGVNINLISTDKNGKKKLNNSKLEEEQIRAISEEATELLGKNSLTDDERKRLDYIQLLVLLNVKQTPWLNKLPFGIFKRYMVMMDDVAKKIGHAAGKKAQKTVKDRVAIDEYLRERGEDELGLTREKDPRTVRYNGTDDIVTRIGDSSDFEIGE